MYTERISHARERITGGGMGKNLPLNKKLGLFSAIIMLPLMGLIIYLIAELINVGNSYNQIVKNITIASGYNFTFREELDYTMYRIVVNEKTFEELVKYENIYNDYEGDHLKDPYLIINNAKRSFTNLMESTNKAENKGGYEELGWIVKSITRLEGVVQNVEDNIENRAPYRENEKLLNSAIFILTEMTQETIQKYIQDEAHAMEQVRQELELHQKQAVSISIYASVLILLCSLLVSRGITQSVTIPIKELCKAADQIAKGDFTTHTEIEAGDEIQVLSNSFNHMKVEIGQLIEDVKTEKDNLRATELKLLQAQINPHFLYNTLEAIMWLAESGQTDQVVDMVTSLSEFFRTVLSEGKDFITVHEETSHIQSYLSIQQFRYQDILEYEVDIDEELNHYMILKLTLQPIVENALYHGIKNKRGKGKILVRGYLEDEDMVFQVADNGIGLSKERLEKLRQSVKRRGTEQEGFGLANVDERIAMTYGPEYGLFFESEEGKGMVVTVRIHASLNIAK